MKQCLAAITAGVIVLTIATGASASTASQREYKRGYADCAAGRWDENQHGESYKRGCRAAEDKRDAGGAGATTAATRTTPARIGYSARQIGHPSVPSRISRASARSIDATSHVSSCALGQRRMSTSGVNIGRSSVRNCRGESGCRRPGVREVRRAAAALRSAALPEAQSRGSSGRRRCS